MKVESVKTVLLTRSLLQQITLPHALNLCAIQDISFHLQVIANHVLFMKEPSINMNVIQRNVKLKSIFFQMETVGNALNIIDHLKTRRAVYRITVMKLKYLMLMEHA